MVCVVYFVKCNLEAVPLKTTLKFLHCVNIQCNVCTQFVFYSLTGKKH